jgi:hypothetical protein
MTASLAPRRFHPRAALAHHKCTLIGWIAGWSAFTYSGAALRWAQTSGGADFRTSAMAIFRVADAVPPYAKISFGALFLIALVGLPGLPGGRIGRGIVASALAAASVLTVAPFDYFDGGPGSFVGHVGIAMAAPHLLAAAVGGLCWAAASAHCARSDKRKCAWRSSIGCANCGSTTHPRLPRRDPLRRSRDSRAGKRTGGRSCLRPSWV